VTGVSAKASASAVSLHWSGPASTGDTPVIGYRVTVSDGRVLTLTGRDVLTTQPANHAMLRVVGGLRPATAYTFTIAAITGTGTGAPTSVQATTAS
jgi:hypothetical protein